MIMFALAWWCYPIVMACVAVPMAFFWLIENRRDAREEREDGPYPCLAYMGRDVHMGELWCWLLYGHDGDHADQSELPDTAFTREWPEDTECSCDDPLPESEHRTLLADGEDLEYVSPGVYKIVPESLPPLPQRLSKVPVQGSPAAPPLCTWGEDGGGNDSACWKPEGHTGPHMVQDTSRYDD